MLVIRSSGMSSPLTLEFSTSDSPTTMPSRTSTTEVVTPFVLLPVKDGDIGVEKECANTFCHDNWLEKVFERQEAANTPETHKDKLNFIQRALESLTRHHSSKEKSEDDAKDEHTYREELQKYIAESSANLRYNEEDEPFGSSDEENSDEDAEPVSISPRNAEIIDYSASIVSISSDMTEEFVVPPVQVPRSYRTQDRQGGVLVAGDRVLFTHWAFKRQMRHVGRLGPLPERGESTIYDTSCMLLPGDEEVGMYSGKIVEL